MNEKKEEIIMERKRQENGKIQINKKMGKYNSERGEKRTEKREEREEREKNVKN